LVQTILFSTLPLWNTAARDTGIQNKRMWRTKSAFTISTKWNWATRCYDY
jgi:hypothetical protein